MRISSALQQKLVVMSETSYQLKIASSCELLNNATFVHWNVRNDVGSEYLTKIRLFIVNSRIRFFLRSLGFLITSETLVICDFRSLVQMTIAFTAVVLRKKVILSEDGLISNIADMYGYRFENVNDGGVRGFKKYLLNYMSRIYEKSERITTQPEFFQYIRPNHDFYISKIEETNVKAGLSLKNPRVDSKTLVFIGQYLHVMGIRQTELVRVLKELRRALPDYERFIYSPHPRDLALSKEEVLNLGWELSGSISKISRSASYDAVTFTSTGLLSDIFDGAKMFLIELSTLDFFMEDNRSGQLRAQNTLKNILKAKKARVDVLSF